MRNPLLLSLVMTASVAYAGGNAAVQQELLHLDWLDPTTSPHEDFYQYANGGWKINNPIPKEYASWGSFSILQEKNLKSIRLMLEDLVKNPNLKQGSLEQKIADFYFSGMHVAAINQQGIQPLQKELARIQAIDSFGALQHEIESMHSFGIDVGFTFGSMQDLKDSTKMIGAFEQGGLSLPDRDYYLKTEKKFQKIRESFVRYMQTMFQLTGDSLAQAKKQAATVLRIETELAQCSMTQIEQRDPHAIYHMMSLEELEKISPHFNWAQYLQQNGQSTQAPMNIGMPNFMRNFDHMLTDIPLEDWKTYLRWHWLDTTASYLSAPFINASFKMTKALSGAESLPTRWKQVVGTESSVLGFALGEVYVKQHFSASARQQVIDMIAHIRKVLRRDLTNLQWMTDKTRQAAIKKVDMIEERVGYPDKWWDYSSLEIDRGPYVWNVLRARAFLVKRDLNKIGKPIDRSEWAMAPQVVNAYYDASMNNINLPMGILQSPYFDPNAPLAVNYGAIGAIIGHEITHGFDDQGAKFDGYGNLHNWWTPEDLKKFTAATQCIINQYSQFKVNEDSTVQGSLVVGEATADLGGLILAYHAFHDAEGYQNQPTIQGFTPDQQFFLSFAHIWANNIRPERAHNLNFTDPHPPAKYRVNGTLANMSEFQKAFNLPENNTMMSVKPCVIW